MRVLELGVGAATDFVNFARNGAKLSGIDLTPAGVDHARQRLALEGLEADVRVASGEDLPFPDESFDLVYSWGVIHHAARPERVVREVRRVLAPGAQARVMLYGLHSWIAYKQWLTGLVAGIKHGAPERSLRDVLAMNTESPGTQAYTRREIEIMFRSAGFETLEIEGFLANWDKLYLGPLARRVRLDWFLGVRAVV